MKRFLLAVVLFLVIVFFLQGEIMKPYDVYGDELSDFTSEPPGRNSEPAMNKNDATSSEEGATNKKKIAEFLSQFEREPILDETMKTGEVGLLCERLRARQSDFHDRRRQHLEKLVSFVSTMRETSGEEKLESMEKILLLMVKKQIEYGKLVDQLRRNTLQNLITFNALKESKQKQVATKLRSCSP